MEPHCRTVSKRIPGRSLGKANIVKELAPLPDDVVVDKPGKGSFYATDLDIHRAAMKMIKMQGELFGSVASSRDLIQALRALARS